MKVFTYKDYIRSIHQLRLNAVMELAEEKNNYVKTRNTHDKLAKIVIKDKDEVIKFINNFWIKFCGYIKFTILFLFLYILQHGQ